MINNALAILSEHFKEQVKILPFTRRWFSSSWILHIETSCAKYLVKILVAQGIELESNYNKFQTSHRMFLRTSIINWVESIWTITYDNIVLHIQKYIEGDELRLESLNEEIMILISTKIWIIHNLGRQETQKYPLEIQKKLYKQGFNQILTDPDMVPAIYETAANNKSLQKIMWKIIDIMKKTCSSINPNDKQFLLTTLHWDFRHGNMILNEKWIFFIDFSRIEFGDPAIDLGIMIWNLEINYILTQNQKYLKLKEIFIKEYIKITNDTNIWKRMLLSKLWVLLLYISPKLDWVSKLTFDQKKQLYNEYLNYLSTENELILDIDWLL